MRNIKPILGLVIVFSCACGVLYEVIWARQLTLFFGSPVFAVSTVLSALVGGLGLGSFYFRRLANGEKATIAPVCFSRSGARYLCTHLPDFVGYSQRYLCSHLSRTGCGVSIPFHGFDLLCHLSFC